jgi:hypothetical protein
MAGTKRQGPKPKAADRRTGPRQAPRDTQAQPQDRSDPWFGDPYLAWAAKTEYRYLGGRTRSDRLPLLIELNEATVSEFAARIAEVRGIELPAIYASPPPPLESATFCIIHADKRALMETPAGTGWRECVKRLEFGLPGLEMPKEIVAPRSWSFGEDQQVITAVLDSGLAFANRRFTRTAGAGAVKSRIEYLWHQGKKGLVITGAAIDTAIAASTHSGLVDEDEVYRRLGYEDFGASPPNAFRTHKTVGRRSTHGAHVMDIACGAPPGDPAAARAIVGVQFPADAIRDTSGAWLGPNIHAGLWFALCAAHEMSQRNGLPLLPVVANVSYGKYADSHDGQSVLELAIDELIRLWRAAGSELAVVLPAGNSHLGRCRAMARIDPGATETLRWRIQPDDRTPSFLEIWPRRSANSGPGPNLVVTLTPPEGSAPIVATRGETKHGPTSTAPLWTVDYAKPGPGGPHRDRILISLAPTGEPPDQPGSPCAPAGTWTVGIRNRAPKHNAVIDAWIQRDDTPNGWPITGRQSRFDDLRYERFDACERYIRDRVEGREVANDNATSTVRRAGSINAIATGMETIVAGAFRKADGRSGWYSAGGRSPPGLRQGFWVDAMAVTEDSRCRQGILAAGTRTGSIIAMRGTSVAAPQLTRWLADQMAAGNPANRGAVHVWAATADPGPPTVPVERRGAGRIDNRSRPRVPRR